MTGDPRSLVIARYPDAVCVPWACLRDGHLAEERAITVEVPYGTILIGLGGDEPAAWLDAAISRTVAH